MADAEDPKTTDATAQPEGDAAAPSPDGQKPAEETDGKPSTDAKPSAEGGPAEGGEHGKAEAKKSIKGKRMIVIIALAVLLLGGLGGGFMFYKKNKQKAEEEEAAMKEKAAPVSQYYEMDPFIVNLNSLGDRGFLKMTVVLEVDNPEAIVTIQNATPKIRDSFNLYLRELRTEDLRGTSGTYRLKEELLLRLNTMLFPTVIKDILFKEIIVQ
jgi:flagellar FliL protein